MVKHCSLQELQELLEKQCGGYLYMGRHSSREACVCALELLSIAQGQDECDSPEQTRTWDIRLLNDMPFCNKTIRTPWMLKVLEAYQGSMDWPLEKQFAVCDRIWKGIEEMLKAHIEKNVNKERQVTRRKALYEESARHVKTQDEAASCLSKSISAALHEVAWVVSSLEPGDDAHEVFIKTCEIFLGAIQQEGASHVQE